MELVVVDTGRKISPFDEPVGRVAVGRTTLAEHQRALGSRFGLAVTFAESAADVSTRGPALVMMDHTFLTARLVRSLLKEARSSTTPVQVALPQSRFTELYAQHQDVELKD